MIVAIRWQKQKQKKCGWLWFDAAEISIFLSYKLLCWAGEFPNFDLLLGMGS